MRTNLFVPSHFWTTHANFDTCSQRYTCGKKLYRGTPTFSVLNTDVELYWNLTAIYTKLCAHICLPIFGVLAIFDRNFAKSVVPPSDGNGNCIVHLKLQSYWKRAKQHQNRRLNGDTIFFKVCPLQTNNVPASERDKKIETRNIQTSYFRTYSRRT